MFMAFVIGVVTALLISIPVGPVGLICISRSISRGIWSGMVVGLGATLVDLFFAVVAVYSLNGVSHFIREYFLEFHLIGSALLLVVAVYFFRSKSHIEHARRRSVSHGESFLIGAVLNATNPFAIFSFFALFALAGLDRHVGGSSALAAVAGVFVGSCIWWYFLCSMADRLESRMDDRMLTALNKAFGLLTLACAIYALSKALIFLLQ